MCWRVCEFVNEDNTIYYSIRHTKNALSFKGFGSGSFDDETEFSAAFTAVLVLNDPSENIFICQFTVQETDMLKQKTAELSTFLWKRDTFLEFFEYNIL